MSYISQRPITPVEDSPAKRLQDLIESNPDLLKQAFSKINFTRPSPININNKTVDMVSLGEITIYVRQRLESFDFLKELILPITKDPNITMDKITQLIINALFYFNEYYEKSEIKRYYLLRTQSIQRVLFPYAKTLKLQDVIVWQDIDIENDFLSIVSNIRNPGTISKIEDSVKKIEADFELQVGCKSNELEFIRDRFKLLRERISSALKEKYSVDENGFLATSTDEIERLFLFYSIDDFWMDHYGVKKFEKNVYYEIKPEVLAEIIVERLPAIVINKIIKDFDMIYLSISSKSEKGLKISIKRTDKQEYSAKDIRRFKVFQAEFIKQMHESDIFTNVSNLSFELPEAMTEFGIFMEVNQEYIKKITDLVSNVLDDVCFNSRMNKDDWLDDLKTFTLMTQKAPSKLRMKLSEICIKGAKQIVNNLLRYSKKITPQEGGFKLFFKNWRS